MRKLLAFLAAATLAGAGTTSCSDASGTGGVAIDTLWGVDLLTGVVLSDGTADVNGTPFAGDGDAQEPLLSYRAFFTFDLTTLPAGAELRTASLQIYQWDVVNSPYSTLGDLVVDHLVYGNTLDAADYDAADISRGFGVLSTDATIETKQVSVLQQVQADLDAGRTVSQFRVRFAIASDNDGLPDYADFWGPTELPAPIIRVAYDP